MCTIVVIRDSGAKRFEVYANRDEALDRPWEMPRRWEGRKRTVVAPRDSEAGGTWLGINDAGVFAGLTNRFGCDGPDDARSRGELVRRGLEAADARGAAEIIGSIEPQAFGGFHFLSVDAEQTYLVWADGRTLHRRRVERCRLVISERSMGAAPSRRLTRWEARLDAMGNDWPPRSRWVRWLSEHDEAAPFEGTCVHLEDQNYGTRSSAIIRRTREGWAFEHTEGPPCASDFREVAVPKVGSMGSPGGSGDC